MNFFSTPIGIFSILAIVAIAAVLYTPGKYVGVWRELAKFYETNKRPSNINFHHENIKVGSSEYSRVDIALNDDGFWIIHNKDAKSQHAPNYMQIPWDCVRFRQEKDKGQNFQIKGNKPIELWVTHELGTVMQRRSDRYTIEDE
ncbi:MAG: hypothetical protein CMQ54_01210 [Gammaproteobacteria bacterium]|nr:hypothetical protein [Gammaproteobacteria bacterium]|tara:strand:- start:688 stop:1119 length:432 start_codon:yes stop_codon:yes gene_type:complete